MHDDFRILVRERKDDEMNWKKIAVVAFAAGWASLALASITTDLMAIRAGRNSPVTPGVWQRRCSSAVLSAPPLHAQRTLVPAGFSSCPSRGVNRWITAATEKRGALRTG